MKRSINRYLLLALLMATAMTTTGCWGLGQGLSIARDPGKSTSRFRFEYEAIPNAVVMREDTEPRWRQGRYVFVRGADRVLVISRITSWSETASRGQRNSGNIPDMKDEILERLWITIPQGTSINEPLDLHSMEYRFLATYDRGKVGDEQFARPFRVLGNVRILSDDGENLTMRIHLNVAPDETTTWDISEENLVIPLLPEGKYAKQASPDAVVYSVSRPGELPTNNANPIKLTPDMTDATLPAPPAGTDDAKAPPMLTNLQINPKPAPADGSEPPLVSTYKPENEAATLTGKWYSRTPGMEIYLQLGEDGAFIHSASRPNSVPTVVKGDWRFRDGFLVLHIASYVTGAEDQLKLRRGNLYAILKLVWSNPNNVTMDGDLPALGGASARYPLQRADYPDLTFIPPLAYRPESLPPRIIDQEQPDTKPASTPAAEVKPEIKFVAPGDKP